MSKLQLPDGRETRVAHIQLRTDGDTPKIVGHAALFNSLSLDLGGFMGGYRETIEPGAFEDAIGSSDIRSLFNHDPNHVLGRMSAGTLDVREDDVGLFTETTPPDTQLVRDMVLEPMRRGDITQMSFAFSLNRKGATYDEDDVGNVVRTIVKGGVKELYDISPVTYPAYPHTSVAIRSIMELLETEGERRRLMVAHAAYRARCIRLMVLD